MVRTFYRRFSYVAPLMLAGTLGWGAVASAQTTTPTQTSAPTTSAKPTISDAQVEASVLKALAAAPELANQPLTTTTVYGVVTLSGSVATEELRVKAETIVSKTHGVRKVVDEMTLGSGSASVQPPAASSPDVPVANNDNPASPEDQNMAPDSNPQQAQGSPDSDNTQAANQPPAQANGPSYGPGAPEYRRPFGPQGPIAVYRPRQSYNNAPQPVSGGQEAGLDVTVPTGALLRMRINQTLDSGRAKQGDTFDGIVVSDVVAGGAVAIPRGATVHGIVVDAKKSGALTGRGELSLQLTQVTLGGKNYAITSDVWGHNTGDKTVQTVNSTAAGGGIGALFGAAAAGGKGAAIGAGVGGLLGLASSAASGSGQVYVPSEGLLTFHLAQPVTVATVSQEEMNRLAQGVRPGADPQLRRRYYPAPYYGPVYYRPYPYGYPYPY